MTRTAGDTHGMRSSLWRWAVYAGVYCFAGASLLLVALLFPVKNVLFQTLALPTQFSELVIATPAGIIGGASWWLLVERRRSYGYIAGTAAGVLAAVGTVGFWLFVFATVWGVELVRTGITLVAFVAVLAVPFGLVTGLSFVMLRNRFDTPGIESTTGCPGE